MSRAPSCWNELAERSNWQPTQPSKSCTTRRADLSVKIASGIIRKELSPEDHRQLVADSLDEMKKKRQNRVELSQASRSGIRPWSRIMNQGLTSPMYTRRPCLRWLPRAGTIDETLAELEELVRLLESDPGFAGFITAASVDDDDRQKSLEQIFRGRLSDIVLNTLQVMNQHNRAGLLHQLLRAFVGASGETLAVRSRLRRRVRSS